MKIQLVLLWFALIMAVQGSVYADSQWREVSPPTGVRYTDPNGVVRVLQPSCSGGPVCSFDAQGNVTGCQLADRQFSFFYQAGSDDRLLIYLDQGGACWDVGGCVAAAESPVPVYAQAIDRNAIRYAQNTGVLADRDGNPFKGWSKLVVPACTGDVFWGSNDEDYYNVGMDGQPLPGITTPFITVHHRGFDNFLSALRWVGSRIDNKPRQIALAGSSAGGYGAVNGFAFVKEAWPGADSYLIADAANGVIDTSFMDAVINNPASPWRQQGNMPTWIPGIAQLPATSGQFFPDLTATVANHYAALAQQNRRYRPVKVAQYTNEWDVDQVFYYGFMRTPPVYVDLFTVLLAGTLNPLDPTYADQNAAYCGWHGTMDQYAAYLSTATAQADNYRFYRAAGYTHTILTETPPSVLPDGTQVSFNPPDIFYQEASAGVPFRRWVGRMLDNDTRWNNQQCADGQCSPPSYVICP